MGIVESIILGIVQGLTEFLPISSSAHLNAFPWLFNWAPLSDGKLEIKKLILIYFKCCDLFLAAKVAFSPTARIKLLGQ